MTMAEIRASSKDVLTPYDVSEVLGSDPATIRDSAKEAPERVGYRFTFTGNRMKIPRIAFIRWMDGE